MTDDERASAEGDAVLILRDAGYDSDDAPGPFAVATALGFVVEFVDATEVDGDGDAEGERTILLRRGLSPTAASFTLAHEIFEHHVARSGMRFRSPDVKELYCDLGAAALIAPWHPFARAVRWMGPRFASLAEEFGMSCAGVALRWAEVTDTPLVLVSPASVRVRGATWGWPQCEQQLRRLAQMPPFPGTLRRRLADDPRRIVLAVA